MNYEVRLVRSAGREMDRLPAADHARISRKILSLEDNPRPVSVKKLRGREEFRIRVGDYRVLYTIDDDSRVVTVHAVGHRRDIYR